MFQIIRSIFISPPAMQKENLLLFLATLGKFNGYTNKKLIHCDKCFFFKSSVTQELKLFLFQFSVKKKIIERKLLQFVFRSGGLKYLDRDSVSSLRLVPDLGNFHWKITQIWQNSPLLIDQASSGCMPVPPAQATVALR